MSSERHAMLHVQTSMHLKGTIHKSFVRSISDLHELMSQHWVSDHDHLHKSPRHQHIWLTWASTSQMQAQRWILPTHHISEESQGTDAFIFQHKLVEVIEAFFAKAVFHMSQQGSICWTWQP